jgi:5-methylcytosine-specific restriction endonuclease McrA
MKIKLKHRNYATPLSELLRELMRVARIYKRKTISISEYQRFGKYSVEIYFRRLGGWIKSLEMAGLSSPYERNASSEKILENLREVFIKLGRQPASSDMKKPLSRYSADVYYGRFGSWRNTLKVFEEYLNLAKGERRSEIQKLLKQHRKPRRRAPTVKLRLDILERDRFCCRFCGRSPATHPGIWLEIDHARPFSQNGKTEFDNLQTLCNECNSAKGSRRIKV